MCRSYGVRKLLPTLLLLGLFGGVASAKPPPWWTQKGYANGIPIGTQITSSNWQQFQRFMDPGLIALFEGSTFWHLPKDATIKVGPTWPITLPKPYSEDTEKYGQQVKLVQTPEGGYYPKGYVSGLPFATPGTNDRSLEAGAKIYWDAYYRPHDRLDESPNCAYTVDEYNNWTQSAKADALFSTLASLSDPPYPRNDPNNGGYYYAFYTEVTAPEQSRYFTVLELWWIDPIALPEEYEYVPSLRRSLRLSQAARCAPLLGSDLTVEDANFGIPSPGHLFKIQNLGLIKLLVMAHQSPESYRSCGTGTLPDSKYIDWGGKGVLPFLRINAGDWEVRDVWALQMERLPQFAKGYCYAKRVLYLDKVDFTPYIVDVWDSTGKLYKWFFQPSYPSAIAGLGNDGTVYTYSGNSTAIIANFLDSHASYSLGLTACIDSECDPAYMDVSRYALPQGLMKVGQ